MVNPIMGIHVTVVKHRGYIKYVTVAQCSSFFSSFWWLTNPQKLISWFSA